jgi:hypothetical protein
MAGEHVRTGDLGGGQRCVRAWEAAMEEEQRNGRGSPLPRRRHQPATTDDAIGAIEDYTEPPPDASANGVPPKE